jgi:hypothetical protein
MKKLGLTLFVALGISSVSFAQYLNWSTSPSVNLIGNTNSTVYSSLSSTLGGGKSTGAGAFGVTVGNASTTYYYALLVSTTATTASTTLSDLANNWTSTGLTAINGATGNGRILQVNPNIAANVGFTTAEEYQLVGWSTNLGTSYATVLSELQNWTTVGSSITGTAFFGVSTAASLTTTANAADGATVFSTGGIYNPTANPLELYALAVPEPGTMALAALGGASLLLFRRKK